MKPPIAAWLRARLGRLRRIERREVGEFRRWLADTENLVSLSVVTVVPLLIALVTALSNQVDALPYLLFPPLASGAYTLFAHPESEYASPRRFVGGLTVGAVCGYLAAVAGEAAFSGPGATSPTAAAAGVALTGLATWALDLEEASAFSSALLVHVVDAAETTAIVVDLPVIGAATASARLAYVASVAVSTAIVAGVFFVWRERLYERRASLLYDTLDADDRVLVPVRAADSERAAFFGARLAAPHDAGKVVLLGFVDDASPDEEADGTHPDDRALAESEAGAPAASEAGAESEAGAPAASEAGAESEERALGAAAVIDALAERLRTEVDVPCETLVSDGDPAAAVPATVERAGCDLVVIPWESSDEPGTLARQALAGPTDAIALRSAQTTTEWSRALVAVARAGDSAHAMVDFAERLAGDDGLVSVCTCIGAESERRRAEERLANIVETAGGPVETRVARASIETFLARNAGGYDIILIGSSGDRARASRLFAPPTFERLGDLDADLAVVDRAPPR